ncbi:hypothetical protein AN416_11595 [Paraburkholderia caribensis]|nr:hypothetical protein AN416_11595 [Paraburkholderia caribensis]AUT51592.1 hypothetical protein C2L66_06770 [Paraburkholderia caribensis]
MRGTAAHPEDGGARWVTGPTAFERTRRHGGVPATSRSNDFCTCPDNRRLRRRQNDAALSGYMPAEQREGAASCSGLIGGNTGQYWRNE